MPPPNDQASSIDSVRIPQFFGMDASRSPSVNEEYSIGQLAVNIGRTSRQPLHSRLGLRPCTSDNGNHDLAGDVFSMGALVGGNRLALIMRVSGGRVVAASNVTLE